jgi:DNA-binding PadR family transcriptional regulator
MIHAFDDEVAMVVGIKGAILLNHIAWWVRKNEASGVNFHDGYYWTYNTSEAYAKIFPFFNAVTIRKELKRLETEGYIKGGFYNKSAMNRTKWYTLTDAGRELCKCNRLDRTIDCSVENNASGERELSSIDSNKHNSIKHSNTGAHAQECSPEFAEALSDFAEHRKKLHKPMTEKAKELLLRKLEKLGRTEQERIAILNQSIENGWQGIFPLGGEKKQQSYNRPTAADMAEQAKQLLREKRGADNDGTGTGNDNGNANSRPAWFSCQ